jgi:hypothetical protein
MQGWHKWGPKPKRPWHLRKGQGVNARDLEAWLTEMSQWAARVRSDIRRIEDHLRLAAGDPGAPPPPPE